MLKSQRCGRWEAEGEREETLQKLQVKGTPGGHLGSQMCPQPLPGATEGVSEWDKTPVCLCLVPPSLCDPQDNPAAIPALILFP